MQFEIHDVKFFTEIIKIFKNKPIITIEIGPEEFKIQCTDRYNFILFLDNKLFTSYGASEFSIDPAKLYKYIKIIKPMKFLLGENGLKILLSKNDVLVEITIPLMLKKPVEYFTQCENVSFLFKDVTMLKNINGVVVFEKTNNKLVISTTKDGIKDMIETDVEWINENQLYFSCDDKWVEIVNSITGIENLMFEFSAYILCIKFLFKDFSETYLEIQIPKMEM